MKVVVCAGAYPSDAHPAAGAFVLEQARAVAERHDVVVICQDGPGDADRIVEPLGRRAPRAREAVDERSHVWTRKPR